MLNSLIKKQFAEIFKSYFVNQKTGKARKKGAAFGMFVLFIFIMVSLSATFFGMASLFVQLLEVPGFEWLYFALMGIVAVLFGLLGSVFNTYSSLYLAKDNELLLSMPIPVKYLLISRLTSVVGLSLIYSGCVMVPTTIAYLVFAKFSLKALVFQIILIPVVAIFVSVLSCLLGFVVAVISSKLKNKSLITVVISLACIGVYYFFCFRMSSIIKAVVSNSQAVGKGIKVWGNLLYQIGKASTGDLLSFCIFVAVTLLLFVVCFVVLSKTFIGLTTMNKGEKKIVYKKEAEKQSTIDSALLKKEIKRFTSSATYMLNCGFGFVVLPIMGIIAIIKRSDILSLLDLMKAETPELYNLVPLFVLVVIFLTASVGNISTPSISLEGKNLWIYKSLPIDTYKILKAKINTHIYIAAVPVVIASVLLCIATGMGFSNIVLVTCASFILVCVSGTLGFILGLLKPNLNWVTETTPIKQSMPVFINMLIGFAIPIAIGALGYFLRKYIETTNFIICVIVVLAISNRFLDKWVRTKGTVVFENL